MPANDNFDIILRRHEEIGARLTEGVGGSEYASLSRELAELDPLVGAIKAWRAKETERDDLEALLTDPGLDREMREMAEGERQRAVEDIEAMAQDIRIALLPKDAADEGNAILEVRAGTGGDEAALFAGDLFRMYLKYAESRGWKVDILSAS
jgi:peptide chain release factor 1